MSGGGGGPAGGGEAEQAPGTVLLHLLQHRCMVKCQREVVDGDGDLGREACVRGCELACGTPLVRWGQASSVIKLETREFFVAKPTSNSSDEEVGGTKLEAVANALAHGCSSECAVERPNHIQACQRGCSTFVEAIVART